MIYFSSRILKIKEENKHFSREIEFLSTICSSFYYIFSKIITFINVFFPSHFRMEK
jgi:hypothetical protein